MSIVKKTFVMPQIKIKIDTIALCAKTTMCPVGIGNENGPTLHFLEMPRNGETVKMKLQHGSVSNFGFDTVDVIFNTGERLPRYEFHPNKKFEEGLHPTFYFATNQEFEIAD